jgi:hypothetical protein
MGARIYIPLLGRFLQVDPIEGGVDNNYVYPPDPVNDFDLTGEASWGSIKKFAKDNWKDAVSVAGSAVCIAATVGACMVATIAVVGASTAASGYSSYKSSKSTGRAISSAAKTALIAGSIEIATRNIKPVRWFGRGREYKSLTKALYGARGWNKAGLRRLGANALKGSGGCLAEKYANSGVDWGIGRYNHYRKIQKMKSRVKNGLWSYRA